MPGTAGLAAINGAIDAAVRTLAKELAPTRINAVSPGVIDTPWWDAMPKEAKERVFGEVAERLPVRRVGRPEDVAQAIAFLVHCDRHGPRGGWRRASELIHKSVEPYLWTATMGADL